MAKRKSTARISLRSLVTALRPKRRKVTRRKSTRRKTTRRKTTRRKSSRRRR